jgi:phosphatidylserine decarboxylase
MHLIADRKGNITQENTLQDRILENLYSRKLGRLLLKPLVTPLFSRMAGSFLDSGLSTLLIRNFIRFHGIDMWDYEPKKYRSFNEFFTRRLAEGARKMEKAPEVLVSPCDSRVSVYEINDDCVFRVKHTPYTVESLLKDRKLAAEYAGGYVWLFRLCVGDYHRYIYADSGTIRKFVRIPGVLHTVNPVANEQFPIYKENTREFCILQSENFGKMIQMEVGALLVGKIINHPRGCVVRRGWEKGRFAFGGSTVILITGRGAARPDADILENSRQGIETRVRLGERVGASAAGE